MEQIEIYNSITDESIKAIEKYIATFEIICLIIEKKYDREKYDNILKLFDLKESDFQTLKHHYNLCAMEYDYKNTINKTFHNWIKHLLVLCQPLIFKN